MSADLQEHAAHSAETSHAFDSPEEVAHAKEHAFQNIWFFAGFLSLILIAVFNYEFYGVENTWIILLLAASRVALITAFFAWLFRHFSYVLRTFIFAVFFLLGMIFLSMWDSTLPTFGNPILRTGNNDQHLFHPKPLPPAKP
ncbi:MAG TPA: hypothetical protein VL981_01785 [Candidatus Methylacidiphilales bacterium]|nr:hypothetical protein [Candidatus Methylacidiphilales bacterium]